jgi:hypothetical protein
VGRRRAPPRHHAGTLVRSVDGLHDEVVAASGNCALDRRPDRGGVARRRVVPTHAR